MEHIAPDQAAIEHNRSVERDGERLREELTEWIEKNGIVSVYLDTPRHSVEIHSAKLPPRIKPVLTKWGSIYIVDDRP